ncbi:Lrp/AsnC family transcriptional regulator [Clostridium gasigenes]|uniref:AsnC family transcriptional regulator n=1 Tax=Clostridium gasigenes TaxID=94869 RepID=A0A7X0SCS7_9CLOT|nr:AsnC family transcriptional regulator [Clostridium gasigenes]MBB6715266.1 AsnC family transcriptional regulator [Clostridium gasigenes]
MAKIDKDILQILKENGRLSWKEVGEKIHMTGQAVGLRVQQLQDRGDIKKFTLLESFKDVQFITVFMNNNNFTDFEQSVLKYSDVIELHKISGDGCYMIKSYFDKEQLNLFLSNILKFGRYRLNQSIIDLSN